MNPTSWMLFVLICFVAAWELIALSTDEWPTISETLASWGPFWALAIMLAATLLFWHVWINY